MLIAHQYLKFCNVSYQGEAVLEEIVGPNPKWIRDVIKILKICIVLLKAEMVDYLTVSIVQKAKRLCAMPEQVDDGIPF